MQLSKMGIRFMSNPRTWGRDYLAGAILIEAAAKRPSILRVENGIGIITIRGIIEKYAYWSSETSSIAIKRAVNEARNNKRVDQILLSIDSPGGSVDGLGEAADAIYQARQAKPIVAQVDGMAASAAYWLASQAHAIYSHELDMVGSIGVYTVIDDTKEHFEKQGIITHLITTGEFKGVGELGVAVSEKQIEDLTRIVNVYYNYFLKAIERGRGMTREQIKPLADGKVKIGPEAVDAKMVDGISSFDDTLARMKGEAMMARKSRAERDDDIDLGIEIAKRKQV